MREFVYICDRCKKESRTDRSGWISVASDRNSYDLCRECKQKFYDFMSKT